ncbi:EPIDERMAL PATTERNING FACTOR-like protein 4 [Acorus calamus]|uniref:Epidermal patterning factor-like protein n=1 Tax=Acorus calamus TaxID=4465 RepID=A0AAV9EAX6_ACOCL|nr:EPIDERMAL PATTERNING FACTOR-like protein 4 [Acorus calamus]
MGIVSLITLLLFFTTFTTTHATLTPPRPAEMMITSASTDAAVGAAAVGRRRLVGPGSSPPTCRGRCGRCFPCTAVHVTIQPGLTTPLEYYPEAWRCKCGDKLFMP